MGCNYLCPCRFRTNIFVCADRRAGGVVRHRDGPVFTRTELAGAARAARELLLGLLDGPPGGTYVEGRDDRPWLDPEAQVVFQRWFGCEFSVKWVCRCR